jgi:pimeloyl-ACP methyl ester carboxylesterase
VARSELAGVLAAALCPSTAGALRGWGSASVVLDAGGGQACTVLVRGGELRLLTKAVARPDSTIRAELVTFRTMAAGQLSGVDAFISRRIAVRGNLALAMQLQSAMRVAGMPAQFPRFGVAGDPGQRTNYLEAGPPGGSPVVLLHGLGATNASMLPLVRGLADGYRVIVPDLPGFGASDPWRGRYDAPFFAGWLDGLLAGLGVDRAVVVGNSLGGRIALEYALRYPRRVRGMIGLAPAMAFRKLRQLVPLAMLARPELALAPMRIPRSLVHREVRRLFASPQRLPDTWYDAATDEFCRVMSRPANRVAFFAALRNIYLDVPFGERGLWTRLSSLGIPALFIWGAHDRLVPAGFGRHVLAALPSASSVVLADCGHVPQFEQPERVTRLIRGYLADLPPSRPSPRLAVPVIDRGATRRGRRDGPGLLSGR